MSKICRVKEPVSSDVLGFLISDMLNDTAPCPLKVFESKPFLTVR